MSEQKQHPRISVEDLIQLKRNEKPEAAFWAEFDREFQQRRLRLLMDREGSASWWSRGWLRWSVLAGTPAAATAFLFSFGFLQLPATAFNPAGGTTVADQGNPSASADRPTGQPLQASAFGPAVTALAVDLPVSSRERSAELPGTMVPPSSRGDLMSSFVSFANDALSGEDSASASFRKVMSPTSLVSEPRPAYEYVAEPLTSSEAQARANRTSELF